MRLPRSGVSELYAAMLMIGATLSLGGVVTAAAVAQFDASTSSGSQAASAQEVSAGKQVSLVYGAVTSGSGGCATTYRGPDGGSYNEGKSYTLVLFSYGSSPFTPVEVFDNGTLLASGGYPALPPSTLTPVAVALGSCAHPSGQSFLLVDYAGAEISIGT